MCAYKYMHAERPEEGIAHPAVYSLPYSLETGFSLNLGLVAFSLTPSDPPVFTQTHPMLGLPAFCFLGDLNSRPHVYSADALSH